MRNILKTIAVLLVFVSPIARAADQSTGGPVIRHVPVTTAVRGKPVNLVCTIEASAIITQTVCKVRVTDIGPPVDLPLNGDGEGGYEAIVPISMIAGVDAFWYSLSAYDANGRVSSTIWLRVKIVTGAAGGTPWWMKPVVWISGAAIGAGATVAILANDDDDNSPPPPEDIPPPDDRDDNNGGSNNDDDEDPEPPADPVPPPCVLTGNEAVDEPLVNGDYFDEGPIGIVVCGTCTNATVSATGSWGASDQILNFNNPTCSRTSPMLFLGKPELPEPPASGEYTITVLSNGSVIYSIPWPFFVD